MDEIRREHLFDSWNKEPRQGEDWREDLTPEELDYVSGLDRNYNRGILALASAILVREKVRAQFSPGEILELETIYDHCRLRLRSGQMYLARLDRNRDLRLDEIDGVC